MSFRFQFLDYAITTQTKFARNDLVLSLALVIASGSMKNEFVKLYAELRVNSI